MNRAAILRLRLDGIIATLEDMRGDLRRMSEIGEADYRLCIRMAEVSLGGLVKRLERAREIYDGR